MRLKDKVALITGGAQGLGKSIALAMAKDGANIVVCDLKEDKLQPVAKEIEAHLSWRGRHSGFGRGAQDASPRDGGA